MPSKCDNPVEHRPTPIVTETHHVVPRSWVRAGAMPGREVELCGTCHNDAHALYNLHIQHGDVIPWNIRRKFSRYLIAMAAEAWSLRPPVSTPPRTTAHG